MMRLLVLSPYISVMTQAEIEALCEMRLDDLDLVDLCYRFYFQTTRERIDAAIKKNCRRTKR